MRVLLDTNILIDYFGKRREHYEDALKIKAAASFGDIDVWTTSNSFTDVFYVLHRNNDSHVIQDMFLETKGFLNICSVTSEDIFAASEQKWADFEDCLIEICGRKLKADYILTRDKEGFSQTTIPCLSPALFFKEFEELTGISYAGVTE